MTLHAWFIAIHLAAIVIFGGALTALLVLLSFVRGSHGDERKTYLTVMRAIRVRVLHPALAVIFASGLSMLFGFDQGAASLSFAIDNYLYSRMPDMSPSYWFITFHVKLVLAVLIVVCDVLLGRELKRARIDPAQGVRGHAIMVMAAALLFVMACLFLMKVGLLTGPMVAG